MTISRHRVALFATLLVAALVVVGYLYTSSRNSHAAVPKASASAAPTPGTSPEVKSVHSPDKVAIDETLTAGQCKARAVDAAAGLYLPDPSCTPGAVDPAVTQDNLASTICKSGYTTTVRADTAQAKKLSLQQYGQTAATSTEYDHLISLQLGGTNSVSNLWPEPNRTGAPGTTNPKDAIETRLNKAVCSRKLTLAAAQKAIARNWVTAEKDLGL
ncbi:hypothetical protein SAMN04487914_12154 [Arthrobacter sp. ok909]|uniref:hypothetical protein n=1 Tax=Arthrobacter sp. ok909 TaxID=1761746 RepID=UPI0008811E2C|nr:hypothetical protein [Arthrobacter sp. ok909]SDP62737.1 hypothetical protein SAMN04487914_12154 [Arthrobacter sp. ok909]